MNDKKNRYRKPRVSIDGIKSGSASNSSGIGFNTGEHNSNQPAARPQNISDFKASGEGFSQPRTNQAIDVPSVVQRPAYSKRSKLLPWRRKKENGVDGIDPYDAKKAKRKKRLKIAGVIVLILLAIFGFLAAKGYINLRKILGGGGNAAALHGGVDPSKLRVEGDGRVNILLLGRGGEGHTGPDLTDTIILVSIDPIAKEAGLVSIPRDLLVEVPGNGSMKINSVFYTGKSSVLNNAGKITDQVKDRAENEGFNLVQNTVEEVLGIPVHYRSAIDFSGFEKAIDTIGGIDFEATQPIHEQMRINGRPYTLSVKKGYQHMDGFEALAYSRSRFSSKRGDFDRSERQRAIITATKNKIMSAETYSNPAKISQLLDNFGNHIKSNFNLEDLARLHEIFKDIDSSKIVSIGLADPPNDFVATSTIDGQSVVIPRTGAGNYAEIHSYIRNTLKDSFIKDENASVLVLNGTSKSGLGKEKVEELKSYGYKVIGSDNAPTLNYPKTILIDMRDGDKKYTKHYLQRRFKVFATGSLPDKTIQPSFADFVIILGSDI
ncbi:LCP family protein [Candidatus Parcubacteria bacterium]|nr:LCP family protein [Candidatus Parcubacteria bacterium]